MSMGGLFILLLILSIPLGLVIALLIDDYTPIIIIPLVAIALWMLLLLLGITFPPQSNLYDVTIRAHYIDGHSVIIKKDSIYKNELPEIRCRRGHYYLDFAGRRTPAVIRFDYIDKKEYSAE